MTDSTLSQIARKMAAESDFEDVGTRYPYILSLIREAMLLALQKAEQAVLQTTDCPVANSDESQVRHYALRAGAHAISELKSELIPQEESR